MKLQEAEPISFILLCVQVLACVSAMIFYGQDYIQYLLEGTYYDGLRYIILLASINLVFGIVALVYLFMRKWWHLLYAILLGLCMDLVVGFSPFHLAGLIISICVLATLLLFRNRFMF